jgi:uncharacterized membrane protein YjgN (DUF898 family)
LFAEGKMIVPTFGMLLQALLLAGSIWFLIQMGGRFRDDLATLRQKRHDYQYRNDPVVLERMKTEERRRNYREMCVLEFRSEAVTLALLWSLTLLAGIYALATTVRIARGILSAF